MTRQPNSAEVILTAVLIVLALATILYLMWGGK